MITLPRREKFVANRPRDLNQMSLSLTHSGYVTYRSDTIVPDRGAPFKSNEAADRAKRSRCKSKLCVGDKRCQTEMKQNAEIHFNPLGA